MGLLLRQRKKFRLSKIIFIACLAWFFLISVSPIPTWFAKQWEKPYAEPLLQVSESSPAYIVVLGGGHTYAPTLPAGGQLSLQALGRLAEAIRLYRQKPSSKLILSGYGRLHSPAQAELLALTAVDLGVAPVDTLINPLPATTKAEAYTLARRLPGVDSILLVTNALHMRRAMFWFRQAGFQPVPAPTNLEVKPEPGEFPYTFWPSTRKISLTKKLFHEWVGSAYGIWKTQ